MLITRHGFALIAIAVGDGIFASHAEGLLGHLHARCRLPALVLGEQHKPLDALHQRAIEAAMAARDEGTVPCNNDLLAENFIDVRGEFRLIDYEYSGNNDACFELGNVWSESNLALDQLDELIGHYYGRPIRNKVARARLWGLMSKYGWTLWASIQDGVSEIDFDFWSWGMERYDRAVAEFDGPEFEQLLEDVQRDD